MRKLLLGLGMAAGGAATVLALSDGGLDRLRGWLRERSGELKGNPLDETRGKLEQFGATAKSYAGNALGGAARTLEDEAAEAKPA